MNSSCRGVLLKSGLLMRLASLPPLLLPLLLVDCGSKQDLFIGEIFVQTAGGGASAATGGTGADATGGTFNVAGNGGSTDVGGTSDAGGAETAGAPGMSTDDNCVDGDAPIAESLIHRYSFDGTGAVALDSVSGADGTIIGATLDGRGSVPSLRRRVPRIPYLRLCPEHVPATNAARAWPREPVASTGAQPLPLTSHVISAGAVSGAPQGHQLTLASRNRYNSGCARSKHRGLCQYESS